MVSPHTVAVVGDDSADDSDTVRALERRGYDARSRADTRVAEVDCLIVEGHISNAESRAVLERVRDDPGVV